MPGAKPPEGDRIPAFFTRAGTRSTPSPEIKKARIFKDSQRVKRELKPNETGPFTLCHPFVNINKL